jgi:glycerol dehydrogenase-like iron-containing ADH family enzyme
MKAVCFARHWGAYNSGEIAGFEADVADRLIAAGVAVAVVGEEAPATASAVDETVTEAAPRRGRPRKG